MYRIARLLGTTPEPGPRSPKWRALTAVAVGAVVTIAGIAHSASRVGQQGDDAMLEVVRQVAAAGLPADQVRELYDLLVARNSEAEQKMHRELAGIQTRLDIAIETGRISVADAEIRFAGAKAKMDDHRDQVFMVEALGMTRGEAHIAMTRENLEEAVATGKVSREDADAKIAEIKSAIDLRAEYAAQMEAADKKIREAVAAGELSAQEGSTKMEVLRKSVGVKIRLQHAKAELATAVKAGKITPEQAADRIETMKKQIATDKTDQRIEWEAVKARIDGAIERGDMTREEADKVYQKIRARMAADGEKRTDDGERSNLGTGIGGIITEVHRDGITLRTERGEVRVFVNDRTRITLNNRSTGLGDLQAGDRTRAQGERTDRGFVASMISAHRRDGGDDGDDGDGIIRIGGVITEVHDDGITLRTERGEVRVFVNDRTRITLNDRPAELGDLQARDRTRVQGKRTDRGFVGLQIMAFRR